ISSRERGIESIERFLDQRGVAGGFDGVFVDSAVQHYLQQDGGGPSLSLGGSPISLAATARGPGAFTGTVHQYAADYIRLAPQDVPMRLGFQGPVSTPLLPTEAPSGDFFWWSNRGDSIDTTLTRRFDLTGVSRASLTFRLWHDIEETFDYAYVEASRDGGLTWEVLAGEHTTEEDPLDQSFGPAYTGNSGGGGKPVWRQESVDLTPYAGAPVWVRFEYITDQAVDNDGLAIDDIAIPEIDFFDDAESTTGWDADGFVRTNNLVRQRFAVRVLVLGDQPRVLELPLDAANRGELVLPANTNAVLLVAALAPSTTVAVEYAYALEPAPDASTARTSVLPRMKWEGGQLRRHPLHDLVQIVGQPLYPVVRSLDVAPSVELLLSHGVTPDGLAASRGHTPHYTLTRMETGQRSELHYLGGGVTDGIQFLLDSIDAYL
ncbi:MAG: hypothetical protein V3V35_07030, partial [Dehalococcoidia bacterium]